VSYCLENVMYPELVMYIDTILSPIYTVFMKYVTFTMRRKLSQEIILHHLSWMHLYYSRKCHQSGCQEMLWKFCAIQLHKKSRKCWNVMYTGNVQKCGISVTFKEISLYLKCSSSSCGRGDWCRPLKPLPWQACLRNKLFLDSQASCVSAKSDNVCSIST